MTWFVYLAKFKHGLYTGTTMDLNRRIIQHNNGSGAKSLIGKGPISLVYSESFQTHSEALKREYEIKGWRREKKLNLISGR